MTNGFSLSVFKTNVNMETIHNWSQYFNVFAKCYHLGDIGRRKCLGPIYRRVNLIHGQSTVDKPVSAFHPPTNMRMIVRCMHNRMLTVRRSAHTTCIHNNIWTKTFYAICLSALWWHLANGLKSEHKVSMLLESHGFKQSWKVMEKSCNTISVMESDGKVNLKDYKLYGFKQMYIFHITTLKCTKLMIHIQQRQYKVLNHMYVFQNFSGMRTLDPI